MSEKPDLNAIIITVQLAKTEIKFKKKKKNQFRNQIGPSLVKKINIIQKGLTIRKSHIHPKIQMGPTKARKSKADARQRS